MRKPRDYKSEYAHRLAKAFARGLTRAQGRGHARAGETRLSTRSAPVTPDPKLETALKEMRRGASLAEASKKHHVARERLSAHIKTAAGAAREGRDWTFNDQRLRRVLIYADGHDRPQTVEVAGYEPARLAGQHFDEAHKVLADHDLYPAFARRWSRVTVKDRNGVRYTLSIDLNQIYRASTASDRSFEEIYRFTQ